jgi:Domain of unknown function (DUF4159)/Aerotolerance regulator N-terminal
MNGLLPIAFGSPLVLGGLLVLPLIWWLLRVTPPRPDIETFPPLKILAKVLKNEVTPRKMPWWLLLLRLALAALVILALADPVLNPVTRLSNGTGPLAIVIDNGWPSQRLAESQMRTATSLIDEAEASGRTIHIAATAALPSVETGPFDPATARTVLATLAPQPVSPDRQGALTRLGQALGSNSGATLAYLSDGVADAADTEAFKPVESAGLESFLWFAPDPLPFAAVTAITNSAETLDIEIARYGASGPLTVAAFDGRGRRIGEAIADSGQMTVAKLAAPFELRNDIQSVTVEGERLAAATYVLDGNLKRRRVALLSGAEADQAQPLLSPLYYIRKAIEPFADIILPRNADAGSAITEVLESRPSVIVMADIGQIPDAAAQPLRDFINRGGVLIRFAGPRLAAAEGDEFLPVTLRQGERALGGSMSWTEPQPVSEFSKSGPFAALSPPRDVTVTRQVLAEPDAELAARTWASLTDGTPLVTAADRGKGRIVLFHVAPQATWSNLPISGSFVDMLRQTIQLSTGGTAANSATAAALKPWKIIAADGAIGPAPAEAKPLKLDPAITPVATLENPPGLYGSEEGAVALNLLKSGTTFEAARTPDIASDVESRAYITGESRALKGWLLAVAVLLLMLDSLAMLLMNRRPSLARPAAATAAAILALAMVAIPQDAMAQDSDIRPGDDAAINAISVTRLAYIETGNADSDRLAQEGLQGLTYYLTEKTTLEPADPVGVDAENDELAFYPMLYWRMEPSAPMPTAKAIARIDAYMQGGGSVLFDTADQGGTALSLADNNSPANQRLRDILESMNVPPLEPVPDDHVLTKSFFLLKDFPGRYRGSPLWVEQALDTVSRVDRPVRTGDGVSPILITGNDFAAAWALDENGMPLYPTEPDDAEQRILAMRSGVNIMMYMLTGNYKSDQVHIPSLLERLGQ